MRLARAFELKVAELYQKGRMGGFCHLYTGEEAVAVGSPVAPAGRRLRARAATGTTSTSCCAGTDPGAVMAELYGHADGCCKGLGGSMHLFDQERQLPRRLRHRRGRVPHRRRSRAWAIRYRADDQVVVCFFGDGATNQGAYHEALNMAGLWKLPIVFVCENNQYAIGTSVQRSSAERDLARKASGYGMETDRVDGMDFFKMVAGHRTGRRKGPAGRGAVVHRGAVLPLPGPLHERPGQVPLQGGGGVLEGARRAREGAGHRSGTTSRCRRRSSTGSTRTVREAVEKAVSRAEAGRELTLEEARRYVWAGGC